MIKAKLNLQKILIGFLIKKGNKKKATQIVNFIFNKLSVEFDKSIIQIYIRLFFLLNIYVEARKIRIKRRSVIVPFAVSLKRRSYLILKWIMKAVNANTNKISLLQKIYTEFVLILQRNESKAFIFKKDNDKQVLLNRSNMHFRW
jgi:ribosomal protein S7